MATRHRHVDYLRLVPAAAPLAPPTPGLQSLTPGARVAAAATIGIDEIWWRLGMVEGAERKRVEHVRVLIRHSGFPRPFPRRAHRARPGDPPLTGEAAVHGRARWDRRAVDAWFDGLLPPPAREALRAAEHDADAAALDANADALDQRLAARGAA